MLKNKKAIYILIPLNIFIWCYLGYSIYSGLQEDDLPEISNNRSTIKLDELKDSVAYKLSLNYKDPFLREGEKSRVYSSNGSGNNNPDHNPVPKNIPVKTPSVAAIAKPQTEIKYLGLVKNNTTGNSTALLTINGKSYLVKKGDVVEGISIKNISNESVELKEGKKSMKVVKE
jgi:type II secretory pathway component PulC